MNAAPQQPADIPALQTGIRSYRGPWTQDQAKLLCRRTLFGARKQDINQFSQKSLKKSVRMLLDVDRTMPPPPLNNYNDDKYTDPEIPAGATWVNSMTYDGMNNGRRTASVKAWWTGLMLSQDCTLREKMVLFWHNHFATETRTVNNALLFYRHNTLLRKYALGNFKELVKAISVDPHMLRYLNGASNTKKAPDENYGRELQELFTVGKGPDSHYSEDDVKAAAHVLTGYYIDNKTYTYKFDPKRHDDQDKKFSAFYGSYVIRGRGGVEGQDELDEMLDMIFRQPEVSKFICRKLYRFFVYHTIDSETEKNVITPLAATFRKHHYEMKPVLQQLLRSEHFFDPSNRAALIKSPVDYTIGACREYAVQFPPASDYVNLYGCWQAIQQQAANMQQNIGDPPNVSGWPAYYQSPEFDKFWINSDTLPKRNQFTDRLINGGFAKGGFKVLIDTIGYAKQLPEPANPDKLIGDSVDLLLVLGISSKESENLKSSVLLSGLEGAMADQYWEQAWRDLLQKTDDVANKNNVEKKLKALYKYLMNLPQYQLC
jgi:uncharacterized protein (DUF1800 family)